MTNLSLRLLVLVGAAVLAAAALVDARPADASSNRIAVLTQIDGFRDTTWHWQRLMGKRPTPTTYAERRARSAAYRVWLRDLWRKRARGARSGADGGLRRRCSLPLVRRFHCAHVTTLTFCKQPAC